MTLLSIDRIRFLLNRVRERLWVRPLGICVLSIFGAFAAKLADDTVLGEIVPAISAESVESLLSIMSASMLVIATFAVASMVSAYASTSQAATPRSFSLVVADDVSQNALSTFIGAFIFSIVAQTAMKNDYFGRAGRFTLFVLTVLVFGIVVYTFVRWVDRIARLGRLGNTVDRVEKATAAALRRRKAAPTLRALPVEATPPAGNAVYSRSVGYVQRIDVELLQEWAARHGCRIRVAALPGTFAAPGRPLAWWRADDEDGAKIEVDPKQIARGFVVGGDRLYDDDPRFGLIVLSEIASRALSPAVNDPGTAIDIVGTLVRLFAHWGAPADPGEAQKELFDRVEVPALATSDLFDDAFTAIARDGAPMVEVAIRLQKALRALAAVGDPAMNEAAARHSDLALRRAQRALDLPEEVEAVRAAAIRLE